jgi:hypothetical protein
MKITLSAEEVAMGASVAIHRGLEAIRLNRKNNHGLIGNGWTENIEGYCAEIAVSRALGLYYSAGDGKGFKGADVSEKIQVRWASRDNYRLIIRPADSSDYFYVLVTGFAPTYTIQGFMHGSDAKRDVYWQNPGNDRPDAWWIPQASLQGFDQINKAFQKVID